MNRYVIDTNLYLDATHDAVAADELQAFYASFLPFVHVHSVVAQEVPWPERPRAERNAPACGGPVRIVGDCRGQGRGAPSLPTASVVSMVLFT